MHFVHNDGGRAAAGYKGKTGDCACRAIAIATGKLYQEVYDALNELGGMERTGKRKRGRSNARTGETFIHAKTGRSYTVGASFPTGLFSDAVLCPACGQIILANDTFPCEGVTNCAAKSGK